MSYNKWLTLMACSTSYSDILGISHLMVWHCVHVPHWFQIFPACPTQCLTLLMYSTSTLDIVNVSQSMSDINVGHIKMSDIDVRHVRYQCGTCYLWQPSIWDTLTMSDINPEHSTCQTSTWPGHMHVTHYMPHSMGADLWCARKPKCCKESLTLFVLFLYSFLLWKNL